MKNRQASNLVRARRFFLTIPNLKRTKTEVLALLQTRENNLSSYMIAQEKHINETMHMHIYLRYSMQKEFGLKHFDYISHGKLEACRDPRRSYIYLLKEDKQVLTNIDYLTAILSGKIEDVLLYMQQTNMSYHDLITPETRNSVRGLAKKWRTIKNWEIEQRKIEKMHTTKRMCGIKEITADLIKEKLTTKEQEILNADENLQLIIQHINNMVLYKWARPFKTKNLLIWSTSSDKGKTSLVNKIAEYCPVYNFPKDAWFETYEPNHFWAIFWNEMLLAGTSLEMFKNFLEGTPVQLSVKGGSVMKSDNPQMFMTSNDSLEVMVKTKYSNVSPARVKQIINNLKSRIEQINVDHLQDIFFLQKLIVPQA